MTSKAGTVIGKGGGAGRGPARRRWAIWSMPLRVLLPVLVVDMAAAVSIALGAVHLVSAGPPSLSVWTALALVAAGIASTEASLGVERMRRRSDDTPHIDLSSVWVFAAAALLPSLPVAAVAVAVYLHIHLRVWRPGGVPTHRVLFSTATIVLAAQAASAVAGLAGPGLFRSLTGVGVLVAAMLAYAVVNISLVVGMIVLSTPDRGAASARTVLGSADEVVLELATLAMGALVAAAVGTFGPAYVVLGLPPLIVLHRTVLVRQLEEAASTDSKTGLLNAAAWHVQATREILRDERSERASTVFVLDLDHFKRINDEHGHLVGDQVLAAVAEALRAEVRDDDVVGRFGGEEFVVLLRSVDDADGGSDPRSAALTVAERIRARVAGLRVAVAGSAGAVQVDGLTVSIGGATRPVDGRELPRLLEVADAAMYDAKRAGRNCVRMGRSAYEAEDLRRTI